MIEFLCKSCLPFPKEFIFLHALSLTSMVVLQQKNLQIESKLHKSSLKYYGQFSSKNSFQFDKKKLKLSCIYKLSNQTGKKAKWIYGQWTIFCSFQLEILLIWCSSLTEFDDPVRYRLIIFFGRSLFLGSQAQY